MINCLDFLAYYGALALALNIAIGLISALLLTGNKLYLTRKYTRSVASSATSGDPAKRKAARRAMNFFDKVVRETTAAGDPKNL